MFRGAAILTFLCVFVLSASGTSGFVVPGGSFAGTRFFTKGGSGTSHLGSLGHAFTLLWSWPSAALRSQRAAGACGSLRMDVNSDLWQAAEFGFVHKVDQYAKAGADINSVDPDDSAKAAIHKASLQGHAAAVRRLVELGADLNLGSDSGSTPLHFAGAYGHLELVATLLELGADPTKQNEFGEDALHMANMKGRFSDRVDFVTICKILREAKEGWKKKAMKSSA